MRDDGKARQATRDALNGDYESIDPAVRRTLIALSTEVDEHSERMNEVHESIRSHMDTELQRVYAQFDSQVDRLTKTFVWVRNLLISTTLGAVVAIATALLTR